MNYENANKTQCLEHIGVWECVCFVSCIFGQYMVWGYQQNKTLKSTQNDACDNLINFELKYKLMIAITAKSKYTLSRSLSLSINRYRYFQRQSDWIHHTNTGTLRFRTRRHQRINSFDSRWDRIKQINRLMSIGLFRCLNVRAHTHRNMYVTYTYLCMCMWVSNSRNDWIAKFP